ncbi:phage terminase large subunit family protein [Paenibacillus albiflavus]|uniref:Phage terminase large subunit family protein n=1 Tax=Paenibacillus albiflavus TaxID=2545760 RepID=A0A4R4E5V9_9BACL|nr:phage terminase large subunit family protein [Paenibacillus albiflavus]TCZ73045.1 phage terminase large subunit family protein [Paenibacillus albiflavus]
MRKAETKTIDLFRRIAKMLAPPPDLKVSEWADQNRRLSSEASAEPGQWRTDRAPYQRDIMDAVNDDECETVVVMSSAQVGKTEIILNTIGYYVHQDPAPVMLVQPTLDLAQAFSKDRLAPMLRDSPVLKSKIKETKSRDSGNTLLHKTFPGGHITMAGANSPASLASRPIRIVLLDEVDRYPVSAGTEGDPVSLVTKRSTTFFNRKRIMVSTPTIKGVSRIEEAFENSSMEHWNLPCPSCGELQRLKWAQIDFDYDKETKTCKRVEHACHACGSLHSEQEWKSGIGEWVAEKDNRKVRGFHLNEMASPWKRWEEIVEDHQEAVRGGPEKLKVWTNTSLGETWEEQGDQLEEDDLINRGEIYNGTDVPDGVLILTAAVDVQDDRFEVEVLGWGIGKESWGIQYQVLYGDLKQPQVWNDLDSFLSRIWTNKDGKRFGIACTCMDSGGHFTTDVYRFCAAREARKIYAIKGQGADPGQYVPFLNGHSRTPREKAVLFRLGVDEGKANVVSRLRITEVGPGYCHFPTDRGYNEQYFQGLTAEKLVTRFRMGVRYQVWVKVRQRNEPLDLRVYNTAALEIINPDFEKLSTNSRDVTRQQPRRRVISNGI